jgi:threonine/homoserine/homoserine lactone efflux protein
MGGSRYATFVVLAALLVLAPGPDFGVVVKNALVGGRRAGLAAGLGVSVSNTVQGTCAAFGLGALVVRSQPVFEAVRWAGVCYLALLGLQALRSAWRGAYRSPAADPANRRRIVLRGYRQGFLSNITNPKVLVFYLSVLPQFLDPAGASTGRLLALAYTHALLSLLWLSTLVTVLHRMRAALQRRQVRRSLELVTGATLLGFSARLALDAG